VLNKFILRSQVQSWLLSFLFHIFNKEHVTTGCVTGVHWSPLDLGGGERRTRLRQGDGLGIKERHPDKHLALIWVYLG